MQGAQENHLRNNSSEKQRKSIGRDGCKAYEKAESAVYFGVNEELRLSKYNAADARHMLFIPIRW